MEGLLEKKGKRLGLWVKRWYVVSGNDLTYHNEDNKDIQCGTIALKGCVCSEGENLLSENGLLFPFSIEHKERTRTLYC